MEPYKTSPDAGAPNLIVSEYVPMPEDLLPLAEALPPSGPLSWEAWSKNFIAPGYATVYASAVRVTTASGSVLTMALRPEDRGKYTLRDLVLGDGRQ